MRTVIVVIILLMLAFTPLSWRHQSLKVGSKKFTESVILGEMLTQLANDSGTNATHYRELGGTRLVYQALINGDIDIYADYTGTITEEILAGSNVSSDEQVQAALREQGILLSRPLGFNNTYAVGMTKARAAELGVENISDLARMPDLKFGFSNEFMDREDGWRNMAMAYDLPQQNVNGLDHDLAYRQLRLGALDAIDVYSTDAKIAIYDLAVLKDDRNYFPRYDAVLLYRADLRTRFPGAVTSMLKLEGQITEQAMTAANARVEADRLTESQAAADFLQPRFGIAVKAEKETVFSRVWKHTLEHIDLVRKSLIPAILIAIPLGIIAARKPGPGQLILGVVGIVQTIPALALLVMLMPMIAVIGWSSVGLGSATAVIALLLYSLLPVVRNTYAGLLDIRPELRESAAALGLPPAFRLMKIEMPLAARSILAGIKTAAVINVGFATLGALIGAGGYG